MMYFGESYDDSALQRSRGLDAYPASFGEVTAANFGLSFADAPVPLLYRKAQREWLEYGSRPTPLSGIAGALTEEDRQFLPQDRTGSQFTDMMTAEDANKEFSVPGMTPFDKPVSRAVAEDIYESHRRRIARESVLERGRETIASSWLVEFPVMLAAQAIDPINLASAFLPGAPAARVTAWLAAARTGVQRAAIRGATGALEGAVGAAAVEPLVYTLMRDEHNDYDMGNSAINIGLGALLGGALHTGVGTFKDWRASRDENAMANQISRLAPETREAMFRASLSDVIDGRRVNIASEISDAMELKAASEKVEEKARAVAAMEADTTRVAEVRTIADSVRGKSGGLGRPEGAPVSLLEFIGSKGGVQDQGGDLKAIGADKHFVPGQGRIVRKNGLSLDYAREAAVEAGYLKQDATIADFLDAVAEEVSGRRVYLPHEVAKAQERSMARKLDREQERVDALKSEILSLTDEYGIRIDEVELENAVLLSMDGMHPDAALREVALGSDLSVMGFVKEANDGIASLSRIRSTDISYTQERIQSIMNDLDELRKTAIGENGPLAQQLVEMEKAQKQLDDIITREREAGRWSDIQDELIKTADEGASFADGHAKALEEAGYCMASRA